MRQVFNIVFIFKNLFQVKGIIEFFHDVPGGQVFHDRGMHKYIFSASSGNQHMIRLHLFQPTFRFLFSIPIYSHQLREFLKNTNNIFLMDNPTFIHVLIRKQGQGIVDFFRAFLLFQHPFGPGLSEKGAHIHVEIFFFYLLPYPYQDKNNDHIVHKIAGIEFSEYFKIGNHQQGRQWGSPHFGGNLLFPHHLVEGFKQFGFSYIKIFRHLPELFHIQGPYFKHRL